MGIRGGSVLVFWRPAFWIDAEVVTPRRTSWVNTLRGPDCVSAPDLAAPRLSFFGRSLSICPRPGSAFGLRLAEVAKSGALVGWSAG